MNTQTTTRVQTGIDPYSKIKGAAFTSDIRVFMLSVIAVAMTLGSWTADGRNPGDIGPVSITVFAFSVVVLVAFLISMTYDSTIRKRRNAQALIPLVEVMRDIAADHVPAMAISDEQVRDYAEFVGNPSLLTPPGSDLARWTTFDLDGRKVTFGVLLHKDANGWLKSREFVVDISVPDDALVAA
jgi:hypothetical protein